jgi:hypothetical protein
VGSPSRSNLGNSEQRAAAEGKSDSPSRRGGRGGGDGGRQGREGGGGGGGGRGGRDEQKSGGDTEGAPQKWSGHTGAIAPDEDWLEDDWDD